MNKIVEDFVSKDGREYKFKIGQVIASSLSGFICGFIVATIVWIVFFRYLEVF